jgi:hypothetical protein
MAARCQCADLGDLGRLGDSALFHSNRNFGDIRREAAQLQKIEAEFLGVLRASWVKARVRIWTLAEFIENPMEPLQTIVDEISPRSLPQADRSPADGRSDRLSASSCKTCAIRGCSRS